ncbi:MAG: hypothetical protein IJJ77_00075 [Paludibacteraceae bacterium]|nr:hypothetical protein [Paludibacteraceae bacterium]
MIELSNIRIEKTDTDSKLICDCKSDSFSEKTMWFSAPLSFGDVFTDEVYDAFLVAILYPAMYYKENIVIRGAVSKKLFKNITTYVNKVLLAFSCELSDVDIKIENYGIVTKTGTRIGTGFSAGVDSFSTFVEYYANEKDVDYKINTLFFFNVGSHGRFDNPDTIIKFKNRYEYCKVFPDSLNIPFIPIDSNVHAFHEKFGHEKTDTITLVSGILSIQKICFKYYLSSGISYFENANNYKNFDIAAFSDPYILPLLSTDNLDIIPDGEQYLRTEKTVQISDYAPAQKFLNVCVKGDNGYTTAKNCSCCPKCMRTLMALESMDKLTDFAEVFDIDVYKKHSFKYKCRQRLMYNIDPFAKDNVDFARKNKKNVPSLFIAWLYLSPSKSVTLAKRIAKKVLGEKIVKRLKGK